MIDVERQEVIDRLIPPRVREFYESEIKKLKIIKPKSKLEEKIEKAMLLPPVSRDLKILRNAFKALMKDLF